MCGRFTLTGKPHRLCEHFALTAPPEELAARYNIAPTQPVLVIPNRTHRVLRPARWGLVPQWARDVSIGNKMINARAETLASRAPFNAALERRRCLIPADGFYEWKHDRKRQRTPYYVRRRDREPFAFAGLWDVWRPRGGEPVASCTIITTEANELVAELHDRKRQRTPFYVRRRDGEPFAFAGLWDVWRPRGREPVASCTIITTEANELVAELHDRMPVILPPEAYDLWLAPAPLHADVLQPWLVPCPSEWLEAYPVSTLVNTADRDEPACNARVDSGRVG